MRARTSVVALSVFASLWSDGAAAFAGCSISGSDEICALVARGDERHNAGVQAAARGPSGVDSARRLYLEALDLFRRASFQSGGAMHHNLLARIARELMFTEQHGEALAAAQECLAQVETDLVSPEQAARTCGSAHGTPTSRQPICQTWVACSDFVRTLSATRMQSAPQTSFFGFVVVQISPPPPPGLRVYLAGNDLPTSLSERRFPVVPGTVLVEAEAPEYRRFSQSVRVVPGESVTVSISMVRGAQPQESATDGASISSGRELIARIAELHRQVERAQQDAPTPCRLEYLSAMDDLLLESRNHFGLLRGAFLLRNNVRLREERSRLSAISDRAVELARESSSCPTEVGPPASVAHAPPLVPGAMSRIVPIGAWVTLGAGAASLAASGVMFALRSGAIDDLDGACGGETVRLCSESQRSLYDRGVLFNGIGNVTLLAGAGLVVAGGIWAIVGRREAPASTGASVGWRPFVGLGRFGVEGHF